MTGIAFSNRLRQLMDEGNVSQDRLAKAIGIARQTIAQYQSGKTQPTADKLIGMADFFGVTTDYLLGRTDCKSPDIEVKAICEKTGLSERATSSLLQWQTVTTENERARIVSEFITNARIHEFHDYACKAAKIASDESQATKAPSALDGLVSISRALLSSNTIAEIAANVMRAIGNEIVNRFIEEAQDGKA